MLRTRKRIKVLVCNRYTLFRDGLKALFGRSRRIRIAGEAAAGEEAIAAAEKLHPDVLLLDVDLPGLSGFGAMQRILAKDPGIRVLILTMSKGHRAQIARCLESGAAGAIGRADRPRELEDAIVAVSRQPATKRAAAGSRRS